MTLTNMTARYRGHCGVCAEKIDAGDAIAYDRERRRAYHAACAAAAEAPAPYVLIVYDVVALGMVLRNTHHQYPGVPTEPDWLVVVRRTYEPEDEDQDRFQATWSLFCRAASDDEAAPAIAAEQAIAARRVARQRIAAIIADICSTGERPARDATPAGRTVWERTTHNMTYLPLYGGGEWLILAEDGLWYIRGNGGDGDNWALSNLPRAIGWRIDATPELIAELDALGSILTGGRLS